MAFARRDGGVFAAPFDMGTLTFSRAPIPVMDGVRTGASMADMAVSAKGTAIYLAGRAGAFDADVQPVWVTRAGVATPIDTTWWLPLGAGSRGRAIAFSPDGRRLAVTVARPGSRTDHDIWIKQLDGAPFALTKVTFDGDNINPVWTADGRAVVYASGYTMPGLLRRRRADGTGPVDTLLKVGHTVYEVLPTRDTATFILRVASPSRDIVLGRRGDTTATPLVASLSYDEVNPVLSPDGRWLAYASEESGRAEVYVRPYPDVNAGRSQVSQNGGVTPIWSHSGRELFYVNGARSLVVATLLPGSAFTLGSQATLFDASRYPSLKYDVAPDDKRFVLLRPVGDAGANGPPIPDKLVQITNWAAEVHAKLNGKAP